MPLIVTLCNEIQGKESFHVLAMDSFQMIPATKYHIVERRIGSLFPWTVYSDILEAPVEISRMDKLPIQKNMGHLQRTMRFTLISPSDIN
ncbi:MAG: hypothetical protein ACLT16_09665 [[Clostridium] innocuum]